MEYHNCRLCDDKYETHPNDGKSNKLNIYLKYLGFCQPECWNKLEKEDQHKEVEHKEDEYKEEDKEEEEDNKEEDKEVEDKK